MIDVVIADITTMPTDAIVNAANSGLAGGGGVDGAIHRRAGPALARAAVALGPCPAGGAVITPGFGLLARYVIHAVGPVWHCGHRDEAVVLGRARARSATSSRSRSPRFRRAPTDSRKIWPRASRSRPCARTTPHSSASSRACSTRRAPAS